MMFFRLNWGEITSYMQKYFGETNNRLCKVSTAQMAHKRNNLLHEILFPGSKSLGV